MNGGCTPQPSPWASRSNLNLVRVRHAEILQLCDFNAAVLLLLWALGSMTSTLGCPKGKRAAPCSYQTSDLRLSPEGAAGGLRWK